MTHEQLIHCLKTSKLFWGVAEGSLPSVIPLIEVIEYNPAETIIKEGMAALHLYIIASGKVRVFLSKKTDEAVRLKEVDIATLVKGDCIGEYTMIDKQLTSASVSALEHVTLLKIPHEQFKKLIASDSHLGMKIYENILIQLISIIRSNNNSKAPAILLN